MEQNTDETRLVTIVLVIIGVLIVFPMFAMGFGMLGGGPMMSGWGHGMWGDGTVPGWIFLVGIVIRLLFLAAIVGAGYLVYRAVTGTDGQADEPLQELRRAYARGELTDEEYERRREKLERDG